MAELTEPGYWPLELGDNVVEDGADGTAGSVVQVNGHLVILLADHRWQDAGDYTETAKVDNEPYRIERREWDLVDPYDVMGKAYEEFFANGGQIHDAVYEGTDLPPAA